MKIGFVSDIHEDINSLKEALRILDFQKCDKIVCLGDIVGYSVPFYGFLSSRNASEVIELLKKKCDIIVAGNHDLFAIRKLPKYKAGFKYPKNWYTLDYWKRKSLTKDKLWLYENSELSALLTKKDKEFIDKLPEFFVGNFDGVKILLSHYAYPDLIGTTKFEPTTTEDVKEHFKFMEKLGCKFGISGHYHQEGIMKFTTDNVESFDFGKVKIDKNSSTWFHVPSVARGTFANGVTIFDTKSFEVESIPLKSGKCRKIGTATIFRNGE